MASAELSNHPNGVISSSDEALQKYAFAYEYDYRNRCISKRLPSAASIYMVYDKCDQLIYTQDGNQRARSEWTYFVYDKLGRLAYMGTVTDTRSHSTICDYFKNTSINTEYIGTDFMYGYNNIINYAQKANVKLVNYYDNYSFLDRYRVLKQELSYVANDVFDAKYVGPNPAQSEKGMLTGSMCRLLDSSALELIKAVYYDDKGNVVQSRESNHLGGFEKKYYQYSFTGKLLRYRHENSTKPQNVISNEEYLYTYDNWDRLLKTIHSWYDSAGVELISNSYNELGQLVSTNINKNTGVVYSYNVRGWIRQINCPRMGFTQNLRYETKSSGEYGCLDGNICEMSWTQEDPAAGAVGLKRTYDYSYDNIDRLIRADYSENKARSELTMNVGIINY